MWSQGAYSQVHLFARALARAGSMDTQALVEQALGLEMDAPEGHVTIDPDNHHTWLRPRIGVLGPDGAFNLAWEARAPVRPDPYLTSYGPVETWLD
jgi:branched-chain amino acid transport system substrate-binding protein